MVGRSDFTDGSELSKRTEACRRGHCEGLQTQAKLPPSEPSQAAKVVALEASPVLGGRIFCWVGGDIAYEHVSSWLRSELRAIGQRQLTKNGVKRGYSDRRKDVTSDRKEWWLHWPNACGRGPDRSFGTPANVVADRRVAGGKRCLRLSLAWRSSGELWGFVPLDRGEPRRLSNIKAHSAAWHPTKGHCIRRGNRSLSHLSRRNPPKRYACLPSVRVP